MRELTIRQEKVLDFIVACIRKDFMPPTIRQLAVEFGWTSTNAGSDYLKALESKGYVQRSKSTEARGIRLTEKTKARYKLYFVDPEPVEPPHSYNLRKDVTVYSNSSKGITTLRRGLNVTLVADA